MLSVLELVGVVECWMLLVPGGVGGGHQRWLRATSCSRLWMVSCSLRGRLIENCISCDSSLLDPENILYHVNSD